jgi:hypothetical protein
MEKNVKECDACLGLSPGLSLLKVLSDLKGKPTESVEVPQLRNAQTAN